MKTPTQKAEINKKNIEHMNENLDIQDFDTLCYLDELSSPKKTETKEPAKEKFSTQEKLAALATKKLEKNENEEILSSLPRWEPQMAFFPKEEVLPNMNSLALFSSVAIIKGYKAFKKNSKNLGKNFWENPVKNSLSEEESLTQKEKKSLKDLQHIFDYKDSFTDAHAGKTITEHWGNFTKKIQAGVEFVEKNEEQINENIPPQEKAQELFSADQNLSGQNNLLWNNTSSYFGISSASAAPHVSPSSTPLPEKSVFENAGEVFGDGIESTKKGVSDFYNGMENHLGEKGAKIATVATAGVLLFGIYKFFSSEKKSPSEEENSGFWWKGPLALAIGIGGIAALNKFGLPDMGKMLDDAKNLPGKALNTATEKVSEINNDGREWWEGNEEEGKLGKKQEWVTALKNGGHETAAKTLDGISWEALKIGSAVGGVSALVVFRKVLKTAFIGKGIPFLLGSWFLGKYLLKNETGIDKESVFSEMEFFQKMKAEKDNILKIYEDESVDFPQFSKVFSDKNLEKILDDMAEKGEGFFVEQGKNVATGGAAILSALVVGKILLSGLSFLMNHKKLSAVGGIIGVGMAADWDMQKIKNFKNASLKVYNEYLSPSVAVLQKSAAEGMNEVANELQTLQEWLKKIGITIWDYIVPKESISSLETNISALRNKHVNIPEVNEILNEISECITQQQAKSSEVGVFLRSSAFTELCYEMHKHDIDFITTLSGTSGEYTLQVGNASFEGLPIDPDFTKLDSERTDREKAEIREDIIFSGLSQLKEDIKTHSAKTLQKEFDFTQTDAEKARNKVQEILDAVEKDGYAAFTIEKFNELKTLLEKMKATVSVTHGGEIIVEFANDMQATSAGVHPGTSEEEFLDNKKYFDINYLEASVMAQEEFFSSVTKKIITALDTVSTQGSEVQKLLRRIETNEDFLDSPVTIAELFSAIHKDNNENLGMVLVDDSLALLIAGVVIPVQMGEDTLSLTKDIIFSDKKGEQILAENAGGAVLIAGGAFKLLGKITPGKLGLLFKLGGFIGWDVPTYLLRKNIALAKSIPKAIQYGRIIKSPDIWLRNTGSYFIDTRERMNPLNRFRAKAEIIQNLRQAQRLQRLINATENAEEKTKIGLIKQKDKWSEELEGLREKFNTAKHSKDLQGTRYERMDFDQIISQKENISLKNASKKRLAKKLATEIDREVARNRPSVAKKSAEFAKEKLPPVVEKASKAVQKMHGLSAPAMAKMVPHIKTSLKTLGPAGSAYMLYEIATAENPYVAIAQTVSIMTVFGTAAAIGASVAGPVGAFTAAGGVAICTAIWGEEEVGKAMKYIEEKVKEGEDWIDENKYSKGYFELGENIQNELSRPFSWIWDNTVGEIWKGENAYSYFSDTTASLEKLNMVHRITTENLHRGKDEIKSWNKHIQEKIDDNTEKYTELLKEQDGISRINAKKEEYNRIMEDKALAGKSFGIAVNLKKEIDFFNGYSQIIESLEAQKITPEWFSIQQSQIMNSFKYLNINDSSKYLHTVRWYRRLEKFFIQAEMLERMGGWKGNEEDRNAIKEGVENLIKSESFKDPPEHLKYRIHMLQKHWK